MKFYLGLAVLCLLFSCAAPMTRQGEVEQSDIEREAALQQEIFYKKFIKNQVRIADVSYRIQSSNVDLCPKKTDAFFGIQFGSPDVAGKGYEETFERLYGSGDLVKIVGIVKGGPADHADMEVMDTIISINGERVTSAKKLVKTLKKLKSGDPATFELERSSGERVETVVTPTQACDYPVILIIDERLNAFADGENIILTTGMMRFMENDTELAFLIGHELAHNTQLHISAKKKNFWFGTLFDLLAAGYGVDTQNLFGKIGAAAHSQEFESEADYVSMYFLERSGFNIKEAPDFWRRMAAEHPGNIQGSYGATHPSTAERFVRLENTIKEIRQKQDSGERLVPNMKSD